MKLAFGRLLALVGLAGCSLLTANPPHVEVVDVQLRTLDIAAQQFDVTLCVTNPNTSELRFQSIRAAVDVAGEPLADSVSDSAVALPPHASVRVPFTVATTVLNVGPQIGSVLRTGNIAYRLHGSVRLAEPIALTLPFARSGRLDLIAATPGLLGDAASAVGTACDSTN